MAQWGKTDAAADSPNYVAAQFKRKANTANRDALYANTTHQEGVFGVNAVEVGVGGGKVAHSGWVLRRKGTGKITSVSITNGGTGYTNGTGAFTITAPAGGTNATGTVTVAGGAVTAVSITNPGAGFTTRNPTVALSGVGAGTGAVLVATAGGKAGRVMTEVLVAGGITSDGADDTLFPDS